jgi:hypothetical protein
VAVHKRGPDFALYGLYAAAIVCLVLGASFVLVVALRLVLPYWLLLLLKCAPGVCLISIGVFILVCFRRCGGEHD